MQEVEKSYFAVLQEDLGQSGFEGVQIPHYEGQNGLATFYNVQRFKMQNSVTFNFNELLSKIFNLGQFKHQNKYNQRVVIFSHLIEVKTGKSIVIGIVQCFLLYPFVILAFFYILKPADLTVRKRPGTSSQIEIHFAVFNPLYFLFCFIKLVETW